MFGGLGINGLCRRALKKAYVHKRSVAGGIISITRAVPIYAPLVLAVVNITVTSLLLPSLLATSISCSVLQFSPSINQEVVL